MALCERIVEVEVKTGSVDVAVECEGQGRVGCGQ
jgi:hypothetical protein